MSTSGLCQVCESAIAEYSCELCGAVVCEDHYDRSAGACLRCVSSIDGGDADVFR